MIRYERKKIPKQIIRRLKQEIKKESQYLKKLNYVWLIDKASLNSHIIRLKKMFKSHI